MSRFDGLLKKNLSQKIGAVEKAQVELNAVVSEINTAIAQEADGFAELKLSQIADDMESIVYELKIYDKHMGVYQQAIDYFCLPHGGYPIEQGTWKSRIGASTDCFSARGILKNYEELEDYFAKYLSEPESPILTFLSYLKRKAQDIPF